jgi:ribosomal protein S18 acetylase RimI-like enzyme
LEVTHNNTKAYQLYKKFGFEEIKDGNTREEDNPNIVMRYDGN